MSDRTDHLDETAVVPWRGNVIDESDRAPRTERPSGSPVRSAALWSWAMSRDGDGFGRVGPWQVSRAG